MAEIFDKAILIGLGLEKKAREVLEELERAGKAREAEGEKQAEGGLPPKETLENRVVEEGVKAVKEFLAFVKAGKEKLEEEVASSSERVAGKLNLATQDELEVVKEMARIAREKAERLEKRVAELEAKIGAGGI